MHEAANNLPKDIDGLTSLVHQLQRENAQKSQQLQQHAQFINQLLEQIKLARHQHFGTRSERFSLDQMALVFNEAEVAAAEHDITDGEDVDGPTKSETQSVSSYRRAKGGRRPLPADPPRVEEVHELSDDACTLPGTT